MSKTAQRTDPKLWEKVKSKVTRGGKGGEPGQWSARKAQLAVHEYKKLGGGYLGAKSDDNSLKQWSDEDWGTKSGRKSRDTGERSLPKKAREAFVGQRIPQNQYEEARRYEEGQTILQPAPERCREDSAATLDSQGTCKVQNVEAEPGRVA